jgi:hypothetical protein
MIVKGDRSMLSTTTNVWITRVFGARVVIVTIHFFTSAIQLPVAMCLATWTTRTSKMFLLQVRKLLIVYINKEVYLTWTINESHFGRR